MRIRFHPEANRELAAALEWYDHIDPDLANSLLKELKAAVAVIRSNPLIYHLRANLCRFPFHLPFIIDHETIVIIAASQTTGPPAFPESHPPSTTAPCPA